MAGVGPFGTIPQRIAAVFANPLAATVRAGPLKVIHVVAGTSVVLGVYPIRGH
jgi:hypothetical protein